jgi:hypothetical protein
MQPEAPANPHHFIGSSRGTTDSKDGIALFEQPCRDGMKDLVKSLVADLPRSS